jgi:hypothetical protein
VIRATNGNGRGGWGATTDGFDRLQFLELQEGHADDDGDTAFSQQFPTTNASIDTDTCRLLILVW